MKKGIIENSGIYKIINKITKKFYLGSTNNYKKRWEIHKCSLNNNNHANQYLQNSWNKHGENNFVFKKFEIIENTFSTLIEFKKNRIKKEQYYLDTLKPWNKKIGYNISKIASGGSLFGKDNHMFGKKGILSPNYGKGNKKIYQYNKDGTLIKIWKNNNIIGIELNFPSGANGAISSCCNLKSKTYKKFIWSFKKITKKNINIILLKKERSLKYRNNIKKKTTEYWSKNYLTRSNSVSQYSLTNKFIKNWKSIKDAANELDIVKSNIYMCINNKRLTAGSFIWKYTKITNE